MAQIINEYNSKIYTVINYLGSPSSDPTHKKTILMDSLKCIAIGVSLAGLIRYTRGQCHYTKYLKWMTYGMVFGIAYSFYFTSQKVETYQANQILNKKTS